MKPIIVVDKVSKRFRIGDKVRYQTFRDSIAETVTSPFRRVGHALRGRPRGKAEGTSIWALRDVSFEVKPGEVVGLIGGNGAGKSTLLKILSRITEPTEGRVELFGRVGSLLEVGTGFHPELTGRENIFLNGAVLGMKRREIDRKFDEIVDFAEVEKFIDTPVKRYSSGMYLRLAFAVAAHLEPEILLVDEVLAVGDAAFQQKCLGKMGTVANEGRTVLFVSHNLSAIATLCPTAVWMNAGQVMFAGDTGTALTKYYQTTRAAGSTDLLGRRDRSGNGALRITGFHLEDSDSNLVLTARSGEETRLVLDYQCGEDVVGSDVEVTPIFLNEKGHRLFSCPSNVTGSRFVAQATRGTFVCTIPSFQLLPGSYDVHLSAAVNRELADKLLYAAHISVLEGDFFGTQQLPSNTFGDMLVPHAWLQREASREAGESLPSGVAAV